MAEDALGSFTSLLESIPKFLADLDRILKATSVGRNELIADQPMHSETTSERPLKRSRISSLISRRSVRSFRCVRTEQAEPTPLHELPPQTNSDHTPRTSQRKRKAASVCSDDRSDPPLPDQCRSMIVTYYDGDVQRQFEELVGDIGTSRIALRKGRMGVRMDDLSRTSSTSSGASSDSRSRNVKGVAHEIVTAPPTTTTSDESTLSNVRRGVEAFDEVDKLMEQGQTLCEKAAFQVLRDGDCTVEITTARRRIIEAKAMAEAELPHLILKADAAAERKKEIDDRRRTRETRDEELRGRRRLDTPPLAALPMFVSAISGEFKPGDFKLEADELDEDSDSDDPEVFLRNNRLPTARLLVH